MNKISATHRNIRIADDGFGEFLDHYTSVMGWSQNKFVAECVRAVMEITLSSHGKRTVPKMVLALDAMQKVANANAVRFSPGVAASSASSPAAGRRTSPGAKAADRATAQAARGAAAKRRKS